MQSKLRLHWTVFLVGIAQTVAAGPVLDEALALPDWATLDITHRTRYETLSNQFRSQLSGGDQALVQYTSLNGSVRRGRFTFGAEVVDARAYLGDGGGALDSNTVDALEPMRLYVAGRFDDPIGPVARADVTLGRLTLDIGAGRLVGRNLYRNMPNAFTGMDADLELDVGGALRVVYLLPHTRHPLDQPSVLDNQIELDRQNFDTQLFGATYRRAIEVPAPAGRLDAELELFGLRLNERDGDREGQTANRRLTTIGLRSYRPAGAGRTDFDLEGGVQIGTRRASAAPADTRDLDVFAHYLHAELGHTFDIPWRPRIAALYDYASGDEDPGDGDSQRFDPLYGPVRGDLGPTSLFTHLFRTNMHAPGLRIAAVPSRRIDLMASWRAVWLDAARDAYGLAGVVDPAGNSGQFAGHQIEWRARAWLVPERVRADVGGVVFTTGEFLANAPNATREGDTTYLFAAINLYL